MNTATEDAASEPATSLGFLPRSLSAKTTRTDHLESLLQSLDGVIFIFFGLAYVCDNLTFLLFLHASCQLLYTRSTQLSPTIVANLISFVTHIFHARPEGTKASRGYLHGGLICDFVGELGPISRPQLLLLDLVIFGLQICYVVVSHESQTIKSTENGEDTSVPQDIEAEEAGIRREQEDTAPVPDDGIEMQPMLHGSAGHLDKASMGNETNDDLLLTLDLRRSLPAVFKKNASASLARSDTDNGRLGTLFDRIAAARAAAIRA